MRVAGVFLQDVSVDARLDPDPEEPLGIEYVLACSAEEGHCVRLFTPLDAPVGHLPRVIADFNPDVAAISAYTPHIPEALRLAGRLREMCPEVITVLGGPHVTADPTVVLHEAIDVAILGEGEAAFCHLLKVLEEGADLQSVAGIALADSGNVRTTPRQRRISALDCLPYPLHERRYYDLPAHSLSFPPMSRIVYSPMLFSRGCNMPCRFCSSRQLWGGEVFCRTPENALAEVEYLQRTYGVDFVYFEDLTFTLKRREFLGLCDVMTAGKLPVYWGCETHVNCVTSEDLARMRGAGCTKILWGVENLSENTLDRIGKKQSRADVASSLQAAAHSGILNWGCYIVGFPWETEEDILTTASALAELDIHQLRISIATPFPGSRWHDEMPKAALDPDLSLYDTNHLVYEHPTISSERMKELQNEIFIRFYQSTHYRDRVTAMTRRFPYLRESFDEFLGYVDSKSELLRSGQTDIAEVYIHEDAKQHKVGL